MMALIPTQRSARTGRRTGALKDTAITLLPEAHSHDEHCLPKSLIMPLKGRDRIIADSVLASKV